MLNIVFVTEDALWVVSNFLHIMNNAAKYAQAAKFLCDTVIFLAKF